MFWRFIALALLTCIAGAGVIDRVAVSVGLDVITESEILREIRLSALQNGVEPDFSPANKREIADRLIEQKLIQIEMASARYEAPKEINSTAFTDFRARFRTDQEFRDTLRRYDVTEEQLREAFRWQDAFLQFVNIRFRTGIQIPEEELRDYYNENVRNTLVGEAAITFEEARPRIEEILMSDRVDNALDRWLGQSRTQLRIRFRPEVFNE